MGTDPLTIIRAEPVRWVEKTFNEEVVGKQRDILAALAKPGVTEIHVRSCHASGKTHTCARAVPWFLACWPHDAIVLTTAPIWSQVEHLLWREIRDGAARSTVDLGGRLMNTMWEIEPKWYAIGIATSAETAVNIQGFHASHVLVIVDEADGVPQTIWDAIDGLTTSAHVVVLAIGNPINPQSPWKKRVDEAQGDARKVIIRISADDVLPFTDTGRYPYLLQRSWVDDKRRRGWPGGPMWAAKVEAEWPDQGVDTLIPMSLLTRARMKTVPTGPKALGVDVARYGTNRTARVMWKGNQLAWVRPTAKEDTFETAQRVYVDMEQESPIGTAIDDSGVGGGVVDNLRHMGKTVIAVNNGANAQDSDHYFNRGSEMWWNFRVALEGDHIGMLIDDHEHLDELINQLGRAKYVIDGKRIRVDKYGLGRNRTDRSMTDDERNDKSPDLADGAILGWNAIPQVMSVRLQPQKSLAESELEKLAAGRSREGQGWLT